MKKIIAFVLVVVLICLSSACKNENKKVENEINDACLHEIINRGTIKVGIVASEVPPMAFIDDTYKIVGFDIDLANKIVEYINEKYSPDKRVKIQFNPVADGNLAAALENGNADIVVDGCVYGENEDMIYSDGYIKNRTVAVAKKKFVSAGELRNLNVAVMSGDKVNESLDKEGVEKITTYTSLDEMFAALNEGRADVLVLSELAYLYYVNDVYGNETEEDIIVSDIKIGSDIYAVGAKKEAKSVVSAVNEALKSIDENGAKWEIADKWFGNGDCLNLQEN